jgi:TRAP-type C4-dicarboxylate transport system permease large subunit
VGLNLFVLQGLTKHELTYVARTATPMFLMMLLAAVLSYFGQEIILWLPSRM